MTDATTSPPSKRHRGRPLVTWRRRTLSGGKTTSPEVAQNIRKRRLWFISYLCVSVRCVREPPTPPQTRNGKNHRIQGWIERSVGFGRDHFTLQGRTGFTSVAPSSLIRPAHGDENLVEKDKNPEEWWPWKRGPRNGHCATRSQWSCRKSREISGIASKS